MAARWPSSWSEVRGLFALVVVVVVAEEEEEEEDEVVTGGAEPEMRGSTPAVIVSELS